MRLLPRFGAALGLASLAAVLTAGCGDSGGVRTIDVAAAGRVALGAIGDGTLRVYRVGDYAAPLVTTTTSVGGSVATTGQFSFSIPSVPENALFLLVVTGGQAYDADEDGALDGAPTNNLGKVHALATAAELDSGQVLLSIVTEIVYQRVRYFLEALYDETYVAHAADSWSSFVIRSNLAGGSVINLRDALAFDPVLHASALFRAYSPYLALVGTLLAGLPVTEEAFTLSREEIRFLDLAGGTDGVDVVGDLAYVCRRGDGLDIYDVTDPENPTLVGNYDTPGLAFRVQVVGSLAFVADFDGGLQIVDVSNPLSPTFAGATAVGGAVADVHVVGTRAYLSDNSYSGPLLRVADVSDPATASVLGTAPIVDGAAGVRARGDFAYVCGAGGIETFDVSDPTDPLSQGTVGTTGFWSTMELASGHLFVASAGAFEVFDLDAPDTPHAAASISLPGSNIGSAIRVANGQALVAMSFDGVAVVDLADTESPRFLGLIPTSGSVQGLGRVGNLIVSTESNSGLNTIAAGNPVPSGAVASVTLGASVTAVDAVGNRVFVTSDGPRKLTVLDASNPLHPTTLGSVDLAGGSALDVAVRGTLAFTAEAGLQIYDVSNPAAPSFVGGETTLTSLQALALDTNVVYAGAGGNFAAYDVSIPATPTLPTSLAVPGYARGVAYDGSAVVLCAGFPGIVTYDATTPTAPTAQGSLDTVQAVDVALSPPYAFVTDFSSSGIGDGLRVVNYATLASPTSVRFVVLPGSADKVVLSGDLAYVSAGVAGVNVVDVSTPASAFHVGSIPSFGRVENLDVEGDFVYVAGGFPSGGLHVLRAASVEVP